MKTNSNKKEVISNIYLYLVTFIGLLMIVLPSIDIIKIGLEKYVFPLAAENEYYEGKPPEPYLSRTRIDPTDGTPVTTITLTAEEQQQFESWKKEYTNWEENEKNKDRAAIRRQRDMVRDISTLIGGLALFLSHGYILQRKRKED